MRVETVLGVFFTLAGAVIIAGFWPSFYADPAQNDDIRTLHGIIATIWLVMVVAQPWLIVSGRNGLHRLVGRVSLVVNALLILSMAATTWRMLAEPLAIGDALPARRILGLLDGVTIPLFTATYVWAVWCARRGDIDHHMRLMAGLVAAMVMPGLSRLFIRIAGGFGPAPIGFAFLLVLGLVTALALRDLLRERRVYGGIALTLGGQVGAMALAPLAAEAPLYLNLIRALGYPG